MSTKVSSGKYLRVGSKKGPLAIGGAVAKFEQDPDFVYVPMYRVAGPLEEVKTWLKENHPDEMTSALKSCYSKTSLKNSTIKKAFDSEVEDASKERQETSQIRNEMKQVNLMALVKLVQIYNSQRKEDNMQNAETKEVKTLKSKLRDIINEKKVLDVTTMKENGTESKKTVMKKGSLKARLSQDKTDPFYHVIYNPSSKTSVQGVKNFMNNYGSFSESQIEKITSAIESGATVNVGRTKSPTRSPLVSPKRSSKKSKTKVNTETNDETLDNLLDNIPVN